MGNVLGAGVAGGGGIEVVTTAHGVRLILPPRQLGKLRWLGLIPLFILLVGVVFVVGKLAFLAQFLTSFVGQSGAWTGLATVVGVALVFGLLLVRSSQGFRLLLLGIGVLLSSHTEIRVEGESVSNVEHAGPFVFTMVRRKRSSVQTLRVASASASSSSDAPAAATRYYSLQLLPSADSKQKDFAPLYPRALLMALAEELRQRLALSDATEVLRARTVGAGPVVEIVGVQEFASPDGAGEASEEPGVARPPQSRVQVLEQDGMTTCVIPPIGFGGITRALLGFGIAWTAFTLVFMGLSGGMIIFHDHQVVEAIPFLGIGLLFLIVGAAMLMYACQIARCRTVLIATAEGLTFTQTGPVRKSEKQFSRPNMAAIRAGASGTKINERPLLQLQFLMTDGSTTGVLTGRDEAELRWLASVLRQAMKLPTAAVPVSPRK